MVIDATVVEANDQSSDGAFSTKQWSTPVLCWGVFFVVLQRIWAFAGYPGLRSVPRWSYTTMALIIFAGFVFYPLALAKKNQAKSIRWPNLKLLFIESAIAALCALITAISLAQMSYLIQRLFPTVQVTPSMYENMSQSAISSDVFGLAVMAVVIAPLCEEVFFRGFLFNAMRRRMPISIATVVSAGIFGFGHAYEFVPAVQTVLVGIALTMIYRWRGTLVAPIAMHAAYNALFMIALLASMHFNSQLPAMGVMPEAVEGPCVIAEVTPGSPADLAGIQSQDLVLKYYGNMIEDFLDLANRIATSSVAGDVVVVTVVREGVEMEFDVTLVTRRELMNLMQVDE